RGAKRATDACRWGVNHPGGKLRRSSLELAARNCGRPPVGTATEIEPAKFLQDKVGALLKRTGGSARDIGSGDTALGYQDGHAHGVFRDRSRGSALCAGLRPNPPLS